MESQKMLRQLNIETKQQNCKHGIQKYKIYCKAVIVKAM